jgi:hypothetical protein
MNPKITKAIIILTLLFMFLISIYEIKTIINNDRMTDFLSFWSVALLLSYLKFFRIINKLFYNIINKYVRHIDQSTRPTKVDNARTSNSIAIFNKNENGVVVTY